MIAALIFEKTEDATRVVKECIMNGVLPVCTNRNSIKIAPPLTISIAAIREASQVMRDALGITA
jgi:acetylornithine/succinyldiaminopimelate/putrescine aminotransferase